MAIFVPVFIFGPNILLIIYGLSFFWGIFMMWFCFVRFFTSNDAKRVREAEENAREETTKTGNASSVCRPSALLCCFGQQSHLCRQF